MRCQAIQMSDQMRCEACNLTWDMNDNDPPQCLPVDQQRTRKTLDDVDDSDPHAAFAAASRDAEISGTGFLIDGERVEPSRVAMVARNNPRTALEELSGHVFFKDGDPDVPDCVLDSAGQVTLSLCRVCGQGEAELAVVCPGPPERSTVSDRGRSITQEIAAVLGVPAGPLQCYGVSRIHNNEQSLAVAFNRVPTDAELQHVHDLLRHNMPKKAR